MTMQGVRTDGAAARPSPEEPTVDAMGEREAARQQEIFESRRAELLAAHPGRHIAVCSGEVFVGDSTREVMRMATRAHPGGTSFFYSPQLTMVGM